MKHRLKLSFQIQFQSKWHTGSGEGSFLLDRLVKRDARNLPYIPGSTLKGIVRENCEKLSRTLSFPSPSDPHHSNPHAPGAFEPLKGIASPIDRLFGNKYEGANIFFRNATLETDPGYQLNLEQSRSCRYRILKTTREKHLFSTECVIPLSLETSIDAYHDDLVSLDADYPPYAYCLLLAGIMQIEYIGGDKSIGSGRASIEFSSIEYNGQSLDIEEIFEFLDGDLYEETR